jgi:hypothetical protein
VPSALDAVIVRALDKDPGRRFLSAVAFAFAASAAVGLELVDERPPPRPPRPHGAPG